MCVSLWPVPDDRGRDGPLFWALLAAECDTASRARGTVDGRRILRAFRACRDIEKRAPTAVYSHGYYCIRIY